MKRLLWIAAIGVLGLCGGCCCHQGGWGQPAYYGQAGYCQPTYGTSYAQPVYGYQPGCQCY